MKETYGDVITLDEAANMLKISKSTLLKQILLKNLIPYKKIGRLYRLRREDVFNYLEGGK